MHCPMCGSILEKVDKEESDYDESIKEEKLTLFQRLFQPLYIKPMERFEDNEDQSVWFKCSSCRCFGDDYPLVMHHPFGGTKSSPGDSWSLSWIK